MSLKRAIKHGFRILANPEKEFEALHSRTLEDVVGDYIFLLLVSGILAGITSLAYRIIYSGYLSIFKGINIDYWRLINYSAGNSISLFFFYIFAGTFLLFLASILVKLIVRKLEYKQLFPILLYSTTPVLFFNWVSSTLFLALLVWCLFLLVVGVRTFISVEKKSVLEKSKKKK